MARFEAEVLRRLVAEELFRALDDLAVQRGHALEVALVWCERKAAEAVEPVEAPLQRPHDAVGVASGEGSLPRVHPLRVKLSEHYFEFTKQANPDWRDDHRLKTQSPNSC